MSDRPQPDQQHSGKPAARRRGETNRVPYYKRAEQQELAERELAAAEGREPNLKRRGFYRRAVEEDAARQGLTIEEYGVYKGSAGSAIEPINSAGGLMGLAIAVTVLSVFSTVMLVLAVMNNQVGDRMGVLVAGLLASYGFAIWGWRYYFVERRAERLRRERGKTLIRPE